METMKAEQSVAPGVKSLTVAWGDPPTHIRLYQWPNMDYVGLYSVTTHNLGDECPCQYRPEETCSPYSPISESFHVGFWKRAQTLYRIHPLDLLMGLMTYHLDHIRTHDEYHQLEAAVLRFQRTEIPPETEQEVNTG